jgi:selenide,water dikinase
MEKEKKYDLLESIENGGCSAKLPAQKLAEVLSILPKVKHPNLLVDIETHDDAGVYKISDSIALIQTVDFFPPICSDAYSFGQIAAANALSDVYAMGGIPLTALNLMMFPDDKIPLSIFSDILKGGFDKVKEAGALIVGGHTINDSPLKYGLAVTGIVHPDKLITNSNAKPGDILILTKPLGTGIITAGKKIGEVLEDDYTAAISTMMQLNKSAGEIMQKFGIKCATDITGFSLLGHALNISQASKVTLCFNSQSLPLLKGAYDLANMGCIPGAAFRNLDFVNEFCQFGKIDYNHKMIMVDAQTSGGILMTVPPQNKDDIIKELRSNDLKFAKCIGEVISPGEKNIIVK